MSLSFQTMLHFSPLVLSCKKSVFLLVFLPLASISFFLFCLHWFSYASSRSPDAHGFKQQSYSPSGELGLHLSVGPRKCMGAKVFTLVWTTFSGCTRHGTTTTKPALASTALCGRMRTITISRAGCWIDVVLVTRDRKTAKNQKKVCLCELLTR